jgi:hypothetical protein
MFKNMVAGKDAHRLFVPAVRYDFAYITYCKMRTLY